MLENGDIYDGNFRCGKFEGIGVYYNKNQDSFICGEFK